MKKLVFGLYIYLVISELASLVSTYRKLKPDHSARNKYIFFYYMQYINFSLFVGAQKLRFGFKKVLMLLFQNSLVTKRTHTTL